MLLDLKLFSFNFLVMLIFNFYTLLFFKSEVLFLILSKGFLIFNNFFFLNFLDIYIFNFGLFIYLAFFITCMFSLVNIFTMLCSGLYIFEFENLKLYIYIYIVLNFGIFIIFNAIILAEASEALISLLTLKFWKLYFIKNEINVANFSLNYFKCYMFLIIFFVSIYLFVYYFGQRYSKLRRLLYSLILIISSLMLNLDFQVILILSLCLIFEFFFFINLYFRVLIFEI